MLNYNHADVALKSEKKVFNTAGSGHAVGSLAVGSIAVESPAAGSSADVHLQSYDSGSPAEVVGIVHADIPEAGAVAIGSLDAAVRFDAPSSLDIVGGH